MTPVINLLATWHAVQDADNDGLLSPGEFRHASGVPLAALSAEYFRRLDLDQDQMLSLGEFPFQTNHISATESEIRAVSADGATVIAIPGYPIICSPEISPDGRWVAVDGWKQGQSNVEAHMFIVDLKSDELKDLGIGCIPHWSADGRQIGYSKYGKGVFIRTIDAPEEEISVDPQGWSIHFSYDGLKAAYNKRGNIVIHTLATNEKRLVFPANGSPYNYIEHNFCWSPDSQRICFKGHRRNGTVEVGIVWVTGNDPKLRIRCDATTVQSDFAWNPDGQRIMFPKLPAAGQYQQLHEVDPDGDGPDVRYLKQPERRNNGGMCWSRDGKTLVFMSRH